MKYFNHYTKLRREALEIYARQYGPLLVDLTEKNTFDWADMPLPWEGGGC
jgi:spore coat protein JB